MKVFKLRKYWHCFHNHVFVVYFNHNNTCFLYLKREKHYTNLNKTFLKYKYLSHFKLFFTTFVVAVRSGFSFLSFLLFMRCFFRTFHLSCSSCSLLILPYFPCIVNDCAMHFKAKIYNLAQQNFKLKYCFICLNILLNINSLSLFLSHITYLLVNIT